MRLFWRPVSNIFIAVLMIFSGVLYAAPSSELWERWAQHNEQSTDVIDHKIWDSFLKKHVVYHQSGVNRFRYADVSPGERFYLQNYIQGLANTPISSYNRNQQRAYWINLYNALTVEVILENYPLKSIRDIPSGFFSSGPWSLELIKIEGETLKLDDIEHRILRPIWNDPRIHYAVNCASIGCPNLQQQAFTAENSEMLLDRGALEFINHPRAARVTNGKLSVSSIYHWFADDFGGNDEAVIEHLKKYADDVLLSSLNSVNRIDNHSYDWKLNGIRVVKNKLSGRQKGGS